MKKAHFLHILGFFFRLDVLDFHGMSHYFKIDNGRLRACGTHGRDPDG